MHSNGCDEQSTTLLQTKFLVEEGLEWCLLEGHEDEAHSAWFARQFLASCIIEKCIIPKTQYSL